MGKKIINTENAPKAIGPYSQAVISGNLIFISGQLPINPDSNEMAEADYAEQTKQCMKNIIGILREQKLGVGNILKTTIFMKDLSAFQKVNEAYAGFFDKDFPGRACVEISRLPKDALVEIEAVAAIF